VVTRLGWLAATLTTLACGGRTDLGATTKSSSTTDAGIDDDVVISSDFKMWYPDATTPFTTHVWHSRDASIDDVPSERVGGFTRDGHHMGVTHQAQAAMLDESGAVLWSQGVQGLDIYDAQPRSDGQRLLVTAEPYATPTNSELGTLDSAGTYHRLLTYAASFTDRPTYGTDGATFVLVEQLQDGSFELETMHDDGTQRAVWMTTATRVHKPSLSWDQKRIVYTTLVGSTASITIFDCASSSATAVLESNGETFDWASFTPDGTAIVFVDETNDANDDIVRVDIATRARTVLLHGGTSEFSEGISVAED
jgi:hypothetical protein